MPRLAKIIVYPIKSFDGIEISASGFVASGALRNDRRFALRTADGKLLNGKRAEAMHRLRTQFDLDAETVTLRTTPPQQRDAARETFALTAGNADLERWCGEYFGLELRFVEDTEAGFPDDSECPSATLVSTPTLETVAGWFPPLDAGEMRRRFRANLEIEADAAGEQRANDCPPFWEDRLFTDFASPDSREIVEFRIGDVTFAGVNTCARCPVPTRDSRTGEAWRGFARKFADHRRDELPAWTPRSPFDHYFRLAVNTRLGVSQNHKTIRVGDRVELLRS